MKRVKYEYLFSFQEISLIELIEKTKGCVGEITIERAGGDDDRINVFECREETEEEYTSRIAKDAAFTKQRELALLQKLKAKYEVD